MKGYFSTENIRISIFKKNILFFIIRMKKEGKAIKKAGFGFGDAMFQIKNLQMDYAQFQDSPPIIPQGKPQPNIIKNPIANNNKKPMSVNKPQNPPVKILEQKQQASFVPKQVFKISAGKEFIKTVKFLPLNSLAIAQKINELSVGNICSRWEYNVFGEGVPADQIVQKPEVSLNFNCQDLKQGHLGNCYFVAALGSVADCPGILQSRIPNYKKYGSKQKTFQVFLFESGKYIEVLVDNIFLNMYCKPIGNDISCMILEKAYAQVYGNYDVINVGHASDALRDITGAPTFYIDLKARQQLRASIKSAFESKHPLVIASKKQNVHPSISAKHSYNILQYQIRYGQLFLKLRDPRGWTKAQFNVPQQFNNNLQNGTFWISEDQLEQNFQVITVCKAYKNYSYYYKTFSQKQLFNRIGALSLHPHSETQIFITLHQKHKKFFDDKFSYDVIKLLLAQVDTAKQQFAIVKTIKAQFKAEQVCNIEAQLEAKKNYMIIGQIGNKKSKDLFPKQLFTISVYSEKKNIEFEMSTGNIDIKPFLAQYIRQNKSEFKESSTQQGLYRYQGPLFGYVCMYYENKGKKHVLQEVEYAVKNVQITDKKVQLSPGESKLVIHPIGSDNNCSYQCSMKSKTFYK